MEIQSRPELEDLVRYDIECSANESADENVEHAVSLLHAHEAWYPEYRDEIV
jgi:hypothetical protein